MKKILLFIAVLLTFSAFSQQNSFDVVKGNIRKYLYMVPNASPPSGVLMGTLYFDTDSLLYYYDGVQWLPVGGGDSFWALRGASTDTITAGYNILQDSSFKMKYGNFHLGYGMPYTWSDSAIVLGYSRTATGIYDTSSIIYTTRALGDDGTILSNTMVSYQGSGQAGNLINYGGISTEYRAVDSIARAYGYSNKKFAPMYFKGSTFGAYPTYSYLESSGEWSPSWIDTSWVHIYWDSIEIKSDTVRFKSPSIYMPDITAPPAKFENFVGITNDGLLFPQPFSSFGDTLNANGQLNWTKTDNYVYPTTITDSVGIGIASPQGKLEVAGNCYFYSDELPTANEPFHFVGDFDTLPSNKYNVRSQMYLTTDDSTVNRIGGVLGEANIKVGTTAFVQQGIGVYGYVQHFPMTRLNYGTGMYSVVANRGSGTITNGIGFYSDIINEGTITTSYGALLRSPSGAGTETTSYGVYIQPLRATTNYGIYQEGTADNYFGGTISIPTTTATVGIIRQNGAPLLHTFGTNVFLGITTGNLTLSGAADNVGVGISALDALTSGDFNVGIGDRALSAVTTGSNNIGIGAGAGETLSTVSNTIYISRDAGASNTGAQNIGIGYQSLKTGTGAYNIGIGENTLIACGTGANNIAIGYLAGEAVANNGDNVLIGYISGKGLTGKRNTCIGSYTGEGYTYSGDANTFIGFYAGRYASTGENNTAIGYAALYSAYGYGLTGTGNAAIGREALTAVRDGAYNTAIGYRAGYSNISGGYNVFIGNQAGYNETGSNKLYIDNSNTATPLIGGDFSTDAVTITGSCSITTFLKLTPTADPPGSPAEGMIYADTDHHLYYYNGTTWVQMDN